MGQKLRMHNETPIDFAYRRTRANRETFHAHMGVELLLIHEGRGTMIVDNVSYEIRPGMLCIFQPNQLHHLKLEYENGQTFERSLATFEPTMFEAYFEMWPALLTFYQYVYLGKLPVPCLYELGDLALWDGLFREMNDRLPGLQEAERLEELSLFLVSLFRCLKRQWDRLETHAHAYRTRRRNQQVERILGWIEERYMEPFRLDEMARSPHVSPYHLSHTFKEATGVSITDYLATRRIHQAMLLLTTTKKPISLVGEEIGLTNSSYFCKLFKSRLGITPHQYRRRGTT